MNYARRMKLGRASQTAPRRGRVYGALACIVALCLSCGPSLMENGEPEWPTVAKKWFDRASASFNVLDVSDAQASVRHAMELEPERESVRLLAANIALSQMRYDETVQLLEGRTSPAAAGLRARAYWYSGQLQQAATELDRLLENPDVKDPWAEGVAQLARSGAGREPFRVTGALLASVDMPRVPVPTMIVPVELNGDPVLAMVATGSPEVVIDSTQEKPSWVSLRFGRRLEVKDVPALSRDLSALSRRVGAPIKVQLGVNLLRRLNPTFDFYANQFVVRTFDPPAPADGTSLPVSYIKGGGMVVRSRFGAEQSSPAASLLVDTGVLFPLALTDAGWQKAGADPKSFEPVPGDPSLKQGLVPRMVLGAFDVPRVPAVQGLPLEQLEQGGGIQLDGVIGSALVAEFRVTLSDQGKTLWLEEMPMPEQPGAGAPAPAAAPSSPSSTKSPRSAPPSAPTPNGAAPAAPAKPATPPAGTRSPTAPGPSSGVGGAQGGPRPAVSATGAAAGTVR